jgi:hypothetical protein
MAVDVNAFFAFIGRFALELFGSAALALWLLKTWIGERLKKSIEHEYNANLEELRARLAALNAQTHDLQATASRLFSSTHGEAAQKRIASIEGLSL